MPGRLVVIGAINVDLEIAGGAHLPQPGETVVGGRFSRHQGGKGGNQAVAAARALRGGPQSGRVSLLGSVGADGNGRAALEALDAEGIDSRHVTLRPDAATGVALIVVARDGANQIAVAPGANAELDPERVGRAVADLLADGGILLASLEVPGPAVAAACRVAHDRGAIVVLNPAPVAAGARSVVELADVLTPNELELAALGGSAELRAAHPNLTLVVTLGKDGARIDAPKGETHLPASRVRAMDTTGAGDTFSGALAAGLLEGRPLVAAARRAVAAAGLSVTMTGAREAMPVRSAIDAALAEG